MELSSLEGDGFQTSMTKKKQKQSLARCYRRYPLSPCCWRLGNLSDYPEGLRKYERLNFVSTEPLEGTFSGLGIQLMAVQRLQARQIFADLWAQITVIGETPDGLISTRNVGSTHPEALQEVKESQCKGCRFGLWRRQWPLICLTNTHRRDGDKIMQYHRQTPSEYIGWPKIPSWQRVMSNLLP